MRSLAAALYSIAVTAWVGSLLAIGFIAAPLLFARIADRAVAGALAGDMFIFAAWVGLASGGYLTLYLLLVKGWRAFQSGSSVCSRSWRSSSPMRCRGRSWRAPCVTALRPGTGCRVRSTWYKPCWESPY